MCGLSFDKKQIATDTMGQLRQKDETNCYYVYKHICKDKIKSETKLPHVLWANCNNLYMRRIGK
jgi:hypothetical protein